MPWIISQEHGRQQCRHTYFTQGRGAWIHSKTSFQDIIPSMYFMRWGVELMNLHDYPEKKKKQKKIQNCEEIWMKTSRLP